MRKGLKLDGFRFLEALLGYQLLNIVLMVSPSLVFQRLSLPEYLSSLTLQIISLLVIGLYLVIMCSLAFGAVKTSIAAPRWVNMVILFWSLLFSCFLYLSTHHSVFPDTLMALTNSANLLFGSTIIGGMLSTPIKRIGELVPVAITAAMADITSVLHGPSQTMIEGISTYYEQGMVGVPPLVDHFLVKLSLPGYTVALPFFGVADWLLVIVLSSSLMRLDLTDNLLRSSAKSGPYLFFPVTAAALWLGVVFAQVTGSYVPALLFVSAIFLIYLSFKQKVFTKMTRSDIMMSIVFPALVVIILWFAR